MALNIDGIDFENIHPIEKNLLISEFANSISNQCNKLRPHSLRTYIQKYLIKLNFIENTQKPGKKVATAIGEKNGLYNGNPLKGERETVYYTPKGQAFIIARLREILTN